MRRQIGSCARRSNIQKKQMPIIPSPDGSFWGKVWMAFRSNRRRKAEMSGLNDGTHVRSENDRSIVFRHAHMLQPGTKAGTGVRILLRTGILVETQHAASLP